MAARAPAVKVMASLVSQQVSCWPARDKQNRLEPECWPEIKPTFRLSPDMKIFTIGSCFARNIEAYLVKAGYKVPVYQGSSSGSLGQNHLNKYTPPTIYQELKWAYNILTRDKTLCDADLEPLFFEKGDGRTLDLHLFPYRFVSAAEARQRRTEVYRIFSEAFTADVVVITLGLVEAWWDTHSNLYILQAPIGILRGDDLQRFYFERLTFQDCYDWVNRTIDLLESTGTKKYLLTTSPVPLARTFTSDDVIIANSYSKSILRAVAGQISQERGNVDYFPSFESVMLTKQDYVWHDDLLHVSSNFVGRIMARVDDKYFDRRGDPNATIELRDAIPLFSDLVRAGRYSDASPIYEEIRQERTADDSYIFNVAAARLNMHLGQTDLALTHARRVKNVVGESLSTAIEFVEVYRKARHDEDADAIIRELVERLVGYPTPFPQCAAQLRRVGNIADARLLCSMALEHDVLVSAALEALATIEIEGGNCEDAVRLLRRLTEIDPDRPMAQYNLGQQLMKLGRFDDATEPLRAATRILPHGINWRASLAWALEKAGRRDEAEKELLAIMEIVPDDPVPLARLGRFLHRYRRHSEAVPYLERALRIDPTNAEMAALVRKVEAAT